MSPPDANPWDGQEFMLPAPVAAALSACTFAVLALIAVFVA